MSANSNVTYFCKYKQSLNLDDIWIGTVETVNERCRRQDVFLVPGRVILQCPKRNGRRTLIGGTRMARIVHLLQLLDPDAALTKSTMFWSGIAAPRAWRPK
jgi:hypothetical protein